MEEVIAQEINPVIPYMMKHKYLWSNYDNETDTLYIHFKKPNHADHSEMTEDDIIIRYEKNEVIGITVLNASKK